jgi:ABC-2 type transport system permease protein
LLFGGDRGSEVVGANAIGTVFLTIMLFPVYYNVLSQFVNRRDELVLKRMRTGETRDGELIVSIALPGFVVAIVVGVLTVPIAAALGQRLPVNPVLYAGTLVVAAGMFTALAYWTAAWTRSAESAQLTSLPIMLLAAVGPLTVSIPEMSDGLRSSSSGRRAPRWPSSCGSGGSGSTDGRRRRRRCRSPRRGARRGRRSS